MVLAVFVSPVVAQAPLQLAILDFPPYEFREHGRIDGITVRVVREVFQRMKQPFSLRLLPWSRALLYLKSGKIHGVFEVLYKREREAFADYSREVLMQETASLFVLNGKNITFDGTLDTLKNYRIGVRQDFSYGSKFDAAVENKTLKHVVKAVYPADLLRLLNRGKIDVLIGDKFGIRSSACLRMYNTRRVTWSFPKNTACLAYAIGLIKYYFK